MFSLSIPLRKATPTRRSVVRGLTVPIKMRLNEGQAGVIADPERHLHRICDSAQVRTPRLRPECVAQGNRQLDLRLKLHPVDDALIGVKLVRALSERSSRNRCDEWTDLYFDRL